MNDLNKFDIASTVTDSLIELFDAMLSMELELSDDSATEEPEGARITGSVRLAGRVMGCINIQVTEQFSYQMTAAMLGIEPDDIEGEEEVKDVISEVCNIVGGNLKSKFCDSGMTCELSPPSFTRGNDFQIESLNTARHERYVFVHGEHPVTVDVGVRINQDHKPEAAEPVDTGTTGPIDKEAFLGFDIKTPVSSSMVEMFEMMLSLDLEADETENRSGLDDDKVVGTVSFVGRLMGSLNIYVSEAFSRLMTANMLGIEPEEVEGYEDIKDVVSEACNIVGGNLKSKLHDAGFSSDLSIASMTIGNDFVIESQNMMRYERIAFKHHDEIVFVEVGVKPADETQANENANDITDQTPDHPSGFLNPQQAIDQMIKVGEQNRQTDIKESAPSNVSPQDEPAERSEPKPQSPDDDPSPNSLDFLLDVPVDVTVELGRTRKKIDEVLDIMQGSVVELAKLANEPVDVRVNDTLIAKGEIVVDNNKYGVRILETIDRLQRIRSL